MTITLLKGDCREIVPTLTARIDAIVSDPPYGMRYNTDNSRFSGGSHPLTRGGRHWTAPIVADDQPFDPSPWLDYPKVILFGYHHFAQRLPVGTVLVWIKRYDPQFGTFLSDAELAWMKGGHGVYCYRCLSNYGHSNDRAHPAQKPVAVMKWAIQRLHLPEGTTILDPYMGSGSTGIAAHQLGYNFIGIEIDPTFFAAAQTRLVAVEAQPALLEACACPTVSAE
jgi:site-specific DNA-methyltransferase (adenine-specific)